jgi:pantoate--beta-alanine ligase
VALVPTMGALHDGHLALVAEARRRVGPDGFVAVSIFVNPTQFGPTEDLAALPARARRRRRPLRRGGRRRGVRPEAAAMYPPGDETRVRVGALTEGLCGAWRPGHFEGVATVVTKLFALAGPCVAVFGRKDYQQWRVVSRLARDLWLPVEVVGLATVREPDGLAMSSRNRYLSASDRARAVAVPTALDAAVRAWASGERNPRALESAARAVLAAACDRVEYVEARDAASLATLDDGPAVAPVVLALAVRVGTTRLIDNLVLGDEPSPLPGGVASTA